MPDILWEGSRLSARIRCEVTQDTVGNRSTVRITRVDVKSNWGEYGYCQMTGSVNAGGSRALTMAQGGSGCTFLLSGSWNGGGADWGGAWQETPVTVEHEKDGKAPALTVSGSISLYDASGSKGGISMSAALTLPDIPRVSAIRATGVTLGQPMTIVVEKAADTLTDTVTWTCGTKSGTVSMADGKYRWTPPVNLSEQAPEDTKVQVTLKVTTKSGGTTLGSRSVTVACGIPESVIPTVSVVLSDRKGYADAFGGYVRNCSQLRVQTNAEGTYGSRITGITAACGGLTGDGADAVFALPDPGRVSITVTVKDSRGREAQCRETVNVQDYGEPEAEILTLGRCTAEGAEDADGNYCTVRFRAAVTPLDGRNSARYRLGWRIRGADSWSEVPIAAYSGQYAVENGSCIVPAGNGRDYEFRVTAEDAFLTRNSGEEALRAAFVLLDLSRETHAVGIGRRSSEADAVQVGLDMALSGRRIRDLGAPQTENDAVAAGWLYPVGAVYISTVDHCAPADAVGGTWQRSVSQSLFGTGVNVYLWRRTA